MHQMSLVRGHRRDAADREDYASIVNLLPGGPAPWPAIEQSTLNIKDRITAIAQGRTVRSKA
jgi:hypothetical protein